jgi:hypothetical protein
MINKKLIGDFADILGNLQIAINLNSFNDVKEIYEEVLNEIIKWIKNYYVNKKLDIITFEKSLEIHSALEDIKWKKLTDKNVGDEAMLADEIFIRYEVIVKKINELRGENNE